MIPDMESVVYDHAAMTAADPEPNPFIAAGEDYFD
jgi:hypothetical protein